MAGPGPAAAREPPDIIFIYTDDQARWGMGAYGNAEVKTPNLDRLAAAGALFLNAFTITPVCSPSRASLFTGKVPTELGIEDWIDPKKEPEVGLAPEAITWPKLLQKAGYKTALIGKWHLGTAARYHPTLNGFDHFVGFLAGGIDPKNPTLEVEGKPRTFEGYASEVLAEQAIRFLEKNRHEKFLLCLHFRAPHAPYTPVAEEDERLYEKLDPAVPEVPGLPAVKVKKLKREYYSSISSMDRSVGRLLQALDDLKLSEKTAVFFTSDNGTMIGQHGLHHKGNAAWLVEGKTGHRPNCFEESIRVPMALRWPGVIRPGTRVEKVVSNLDYFPTILAMAGVAPPEGYACRGRDFLPLARNGAAAAASWDDTLFGQYDMHHYTRARMRLLRTPAWKLVWHFEPGAENELYDLVKDPGEVHNLASQKEALPVLGRLRSELSKAMASVQDPLERKEKQEAR
ncbi:MAG: sulfatase-like hydrolase/transferase [Planctomycetes bacterium]|nr:sulfatase-like hydrolase/transferase [Planctomycetota bacterium]